MWPMRRNGGEKVTFILDLLWMSFAGLIVAGIIIGVGMIVEERW